jgi:hypothetical protein
VVLHKGTKEKSPKKKKKTPLAVKVNMAWVQCNISMIKLLA